MDLSPEYETEKAVLGSLLGEINQAEAIRHMADIEPEDFFDQQHRDIYVAISDIVRSGAMPDLVLTYERSKCDPVALAEIRAAGCMSSQLPAYLKLLQKARRNRLVRRCVQEAEIALLKSDGDTEQVESYLIDTLSKSRIVKNKILPVNEGFNIEQVFSDEDKIRMVPSGLDELDMALGGGIAPGEVCLVAGDTSIGKSATGIEWSMEALISGWPVQYESYEMKRRELWQRALSYCSGVSITKFRDRSFSSYDYAPLRQAQVNTKPLWQWFTASTKTTTPSELMSLVRIEQMRKDTFLLIVDTAQRMRVDGKKSKYEKGSEIIHGLKDIALQCEIPILAFWQLSRPEKATKILHRAPTIHDLRDSGEAEEVADIVILCSRDNYYDRKIEARDAIMTFDVAKGRDGCNLVKVEVPWLRVLNRGYRQRKPGED